MIINIQVAATLILLLVVGTFSANRLEVLIFGFALSAFYSIVLLKIKAVRLLRSSLLLIPFITLLFITWVVFVGSPPSQSFEQNVHGAIYYSIHTSLRVWTVFLGLYAFSSKIINDGLVENLAQLPIPSTVKALVISSLTTLVDFQRSYDSTYDAMLTRGMIKRNAWIKNVRVIPTIMKVVLISGLTTALKRAELWEARGYLKKVEVSKDLNVKLNKRELLFSIPFFAFVTLSIWLRFV